MLRWVVAVLGLAAVVVTVLPFVPSNQWWIRVWDFPRTQAAAVLAVALLATPFVFALKRPRTLLLVTVLTLALAWQVYRIAPYTAVYPEEAKATQDCDPDSRLRLLVANVLIGNETAAPLLNMVRRIGPDVLLLVETDHWWDRQLEALHETFPHRVSEPQENGYGMHLFSRFPLIDPQIQYLIEDYVPSIKTGLRLPSGASVILRGVHPKPPPLQDTAQRDAELLIVAREVRDNETPAVVAGDLNDVAWSQTTRLFQKTSGLLDPRIGRGLYSTFSANWPVVRWPLDHVFFAPSFWLLEMAVQGDIGSDHFPFYVVLCLKSERRDQAAPGAKPDQIEDAREMIQEGREEAEE